MKAITPSETKKNNLYILYSRTSTNSTEQLRSLQNQINKLNDYKDNYGDKSNKILLISDVHGVAKGIAPNLKNALLNYGKFNITIVTSAVDRITRYIPDIFFIRKHIYCIKLVGTSTEYMLETDWKLVLGHISSGTEEIEKLQRRISGAKGARKKRSHSELTNNAKTKTVEIGNIISRDEHKKMLTNIGKMIQMSQSLTSICNWKDMSKISKKYNGPNIMNDYKNALKSGQSYNLTRKDMLYYVSQIIKKNNINVDNHILKEYVNAHILFARYKLRSDVNSDDDNDTVITCATDEKLERICNTLLDITFDKKVDKILKKDEISKVKNICKRLEKIVDAKHKSDSDSDTNSDSDTTINVHKKKRKF